MAGSPSTVCFGLVIGAALFLDLNAAESLLHLISIIYFEECVFEFQGGPQTAVAAWLSGLVLLKTSPVVSGVCQYQPNKFLEVFMNNIKWFKGNLCLGVQSYK